MLEDFKGAVALHVDYAPRDLAKIPLTPLPLVEDQSGCLQFALMFDGFQHYIETEARAILNPELIEDILQWQRGTMPTAPEDMNKLFSRVNPNDPGVAAILRKFKKLKSEYNQLVAAFEDDTIPLVMKLTVRFHVLIATCILMTAMSVVLQKLKEGMASG